MTTKELEIVAYRHLWKQGTYLCFEVMMPSPDGKHYMDNNERVDLISYDTKGIWRFYELKITKSDFHSGCKHTFLGNFNYFIMPYSLWLEVKDEIPKEIGVYTASKESAQLSCVKKAKRQELQVNEHFLKFNFMQALSREYKKYRQSLRFGRWYDSYPGYDEKIEEYTCNICFQKIELKKGKHLPKYCEHCGARMTGKVKDNESIWNTHTTHYEDVLRKSPTEMAEFIDEMFTNGECDYCAAQDIDGECRIPFGETCVLGHKDWLEKEIDDESIQ